MHNNINFTAFDLETAFGQKHICQVGIVIVKNGLIVEEKSFLVQPPENKISSYCSKIHGITASKTKDAPLFPEVWNEIKKYFINQVVLHHSDGFDIRVLHQDIEYYNLEMPRYLAIQSTMALFPEKYSRSLSNICTAYEIDMEKHHDAVSDARCCAQIMLKYLNDETPDYKILPKVKSRDEYNSDINLTYRDSDERKNAEYDNSEQRIIKSDTKVQDLSIVKNADTIFYDKKVVISGVFERYPVRNDLGLLLKRFGADINGSISSKTNIFVFGSDSGPKKMEKVFDLNDKGYNIILLDEKQLYNILDSIEN